MSNYYPGWVSSDQYRSTYPANPNSQLSHQPTNHVTEYVPNSARNQSFDQPRSVSKPLLPTPPQQPNQNEFVNIRNAPPYVPPAGQTFQSSGRPPQVFDPAQHARSHVTGFEPRYSYSQQRANVTEYNPGSTYPSSRISEYEPPPVANAPPYEENFRSNQNPQPPTITSPTETKAEKLVYVPLADTWRKQKKEGSLGKTPSGTVSGKIETADVLSAVLKQENTGGNDRTIENILKSIGFDFELSRRTQEKAEKERLRVEALKREKTDSRDFGIMEGHGGSMTSFLGKDISDVNLKDFFSAQSIGKSHEKLEESHFRNEESFNQKNSVERVDASYRDSFSERIRHSESYSKDRYGYETQQQQSQHKSFDFSDYAHNFKLDEKPYEERQPYSGYPKDRENRSQQVSRKDEDFERPSYPSQRDEKSYQSHENSSNNERRHLHHPERGADRYEERADYDASSEYVHNYRKRPYEENRRERDNHDNHHRGSEYDDGRQSYEENRHDPRYRRDRRYHDGENRSVSSSDTRGHYDERSKDSRRPARDGRDYNREPNQSNRYSDERDRRSDYKRDRRSDYERDIVTRSEASHVERQERKRELDHSRQKSETPKVKVRRLSESNADAPVTDKMVPKLPSETVLGEKEQELLQQLYQQREERRLRLSSMESQLQTLRNNQNELLRRRSRASPQNDRLILQSNKLQEEIVVAIEELKKTIESNTKKIENALAVTQDEKKIANDEVEEYHDGGNHECLNCLMKTSSVSEHFSHLASSNHRKNVNLTKTQLWKPLKPESAVRGKIVNAGRARGAEFVKWTEGFFCDLCKIQLDDRATGEQHLLSRDHNKMYKEFKMACPSYDKILELNRESVKIKLRQEDQNVRREKSKEDDFQEKRKYDSDHYRVDSKPSSAHSKPWDPNRKHPLNIFEDVPSKPETHVSTNERSKWSRSVTSISASKSSSDSTRYPSASSSQVAKPTQSPSEQTASHSSSIPSAKKAVTKSSASRDADRPNPPTETKDDSSAPTRAPRPGLLPLSMLRRGPRANLSQKNPPQVSKQSSESRSGAGGSSDTRSGSTMMPAKPGSVPAAVVMRKKPIDDNIDIFSETEPSKN